MKINQGLFFFSIVCILALPGSCSEKETFDAIKIDLDQGEKFLASEIFEDLDYVLLDYSDEKPIVNAYKMLFTDKHIIVESRENASIFIFDQEGNLGNIIQNYGDGPGEFRIFDGMSLIGDDQIRVTVGYAKKILVFDLMGNLLEETKDVSSRWAYFGDDFTLQHFPKGEDSGKYIFIRSSSKDTVGYVSLRSGAEQFYEFGYIHSFQRGHNQTILFSENISKNIYIFDKDGYLKDSVVFDFGKYNLDWETKVRLGNDRQAKKSYFEENKKVDHVSSFFLCHLVTLFRLLMIIESPIGLF